MLRRTSVSYITPFFGHAKLPPIVNEPMNDFAPGTKSCVELQKAVDKMLKEGPFDVPCIVGGQEFRRGARQTREIPSDIKTPFAHYYNADKPLLTDAIASCKEARKTWSKTPLQQRLTIVMGAAHLISTKYRYEFQAATMIGQSKNPWQGEIDSVAETIDFYKFNCKFAEEMYNTQPLSPNNGSVWNSVDYRPLEGFVTAITPFNFTAIGANLAVGPAMMGNVVLWKPSPAAIYSNYLTMKILEEAGLPPGVINFVPAQPEDIQSVVTPDPNLAAVAFTGSTKVFSDISMEVAKNMKNYKCYPRMCGETGGKNFHLVHKSGNLDSAVAGTVRSAFEYQGQKCSACSRAYIPKSMWPEFKAKMLEKTSKIKMGGPEDFSNFMCAVIDESAFDRNMAYINIAKSESSCKIIAGGNGSKTKGYFIEPTIIETTDPMATTMKEEIFGPVLTCYVYDDATMSEEELFKIIGNTKYGLTGGIYAKDRAFSSRATSALRDVAGNLYLNDKCTGAVVGMQPFGGSRASGTNDKPGHPNFLYKWVSPRTIKDSYDDNLGVSYPHQLPDQF